MIAWLGLLLVWMSAPAAWAGSAEVVAVDGALRPGISSRIEVAVTDSLGKPVRERPVLSLDAGASRPTEDPAAPGVWTWRVTAPAGITSLGLTVSALGSVWRHELTVALPPETAMALPKGAVATVGGGRIRLRVSGGDVPHPAALQVVHSEGRLLGVSRLGDDLEVVIQPEDSQLARVILVGVRDSRSDARPSWGVVRMKARATITLDDAAPYSVVRIELGGRTYGPFSADGRGNVEAHLEHYPEERSAHMEISEPTGSIQSRPISLTTRFAPELASFVAGKWLPGQPAPHVFLRAIQPDGRSWRGARPTCRTPRIGPLGVVPMGDGEWMLQVPDLGDESPLDMRVICSLGASAETSFVIPLADEVPHKMTMRVWPDQLSADLPLADVQVGLENAYGERISADGTVEFAASRGEVEVVQVRSATVRAEFQGPPAPDPGPVTVLATWTAPPGTGAVAELALAWGGRAGEDEVVAHLRALDSLRRPVSGAMATLASGGIENEVVTGEDGWATAAFDLPADIDRPFRVVGSTDRRHVEGLFVPETLGTGGPGSPDLRTHQTIDIQPGRVSAIAMSVTPDTLSPGPSALAFVSVGLTDRAGQIVSGENTIVEASAGTLTPAGMSQEGALIWEYTPPLGGRVREVLITARNEALGVEDSVRLEIRPRPVNRAIGVAAGGLWNFGDLLSAHAALDVEFRIYSFSRFVRRGGPGLMLRTSVGFYSEQATADTLLGPPADVRMLILPVSALLLFRTEFGANGVWFGIGGVFAPYHGRMAFAGETTAQGSGVLPPGLALSAGYGLRLPVGELALELRPLLLTSQGGDYALQGFVGGIAATIGYRLPF